MSSDQKINVSFEFVGNYRKLRNGGIKNNALPKQLNENPKLYGVLKNQLHLGIGAKDFKDEGGGEKLETIQMFIGQLAAQKKSRCLKEVLGGCDFVSTRNLLVTIAMSAYEKTEFQFQAVRHKDVIFLFRLVDDIPDEEDRLKTHRGCKFVQYMTLDENGNENHENTPVRNAELEKVVLRTELKKGANSIKLFYGAEIDAIDSEGTYLELKTISGNISKYWYDERSLQTYLQSYFGNVPDIFIGHRNYYGATKAEQKKIYKVSKIKTSDIPGMVEKSNADVKWNPEMCINKLGEVLSQVKSGLLENGMAKHYEYSENKFQCKPMDPKACVFVGKPFLAQFD